MIFPIACITLNCYLLLDFLSCTEMFSTRSSLLWMLITQTQQLAYISFTSFFTIIESMWLKYFCTYNCKKIVAFLSFPTGHLTPSATAPHFTCSDIVAMHSTVDQIKMLHDTNWWFYHFSMFKYNVICYFVTCTALWINPGLWFQYFHPSWAPK